MTSPAKVSTRAALAGVNRSTAFTSSVSVRRTAAEVFVEGVSANPSIPRKGVQRAATLTPSTPPEVAGVERVCVQLAELIGLDLADARDLDLEREDIAAACGISVTRVNKWAAPSYPDHLPPIQFLPLWVKATNSRRLIDWLAASCGLHVVEPDVLHDAAIGRKVREAVKALLEAA